MSDAFDIVTIGRVGVDLYPEQTGVPLAKVRTFAKSLGGSPTNVAVGAARLGHRAAVITKVGDDGFGVDTRWVGTDPSLRTPVVFAEVFPPDRFPVLFYREPRAPDMNIRVEELDRAAIGRAGLVWTTGVGLSDEPSRTATLAVLESATGVRVHDLDHRPVLWRSTEDARRWAREAAKRATVVVGNEDEVEMATATRDADRAMDALLGIGPELVVVKRGGEGAVARRGDERVAVPGVRVDVLCGLGAGDAFGAALCHGLLARWPLARVLAFANAAGAIVASRLACADAMPTEAEVDAILARSVT